MNQLYNSDPNFKKMKTPNNQDKDKFIKDLLSKSSNKNSLLENIDI